MKSIQERTPTPLSRASRLSRVSRRRFFGHLGFAVASPFVPLLEAHGQPYPRRLLLVFTPHGTIFNNWKPKGTETSFELSTILAPLEKHKKKLTILSGVQLMSPGPVFPHTKGPASLWTGGHVLSDKVFSRGGLNFGWASGASVDQVIAREPAQKARGGYASLELGVRTGGSHVGSRMIYSGPSQVRHPEASPYRALDRLLVPATGGGKSFEQLRAERRSAIDISLAELDSLKRRTSGEDARKVDEHLAALRSIENRLTASPSTCERPTLGMQLDLSAPANNGPVWDRQSDLISAMLACDMTRVASLQYRVGENDSDRYTWIGVSHEGHHLISHTSDYASLTKIYVWYAQRFAYLLDRLDAVREGAGTMLDNTIVVWGSEMGKGQGHLFTRTPFVVAGGGAGALRPGRFLDYEADGAKGQPHHRLLVSLCHAFGLLNRDTFGDSDTGSGPLPGLLR